MIINFVTTNKHKFKEAQRVLSAFKIGLRQLDMEYEENHDAGIEDIARQSAGKLSAELDIELVVEDTGLYFDAYPDFPGALPKFIFNSLGYKGIFKLLEGGNRNAFFKTVAAYCAPNCQPVLFTGTMQGKITSTVFNPDKDVMPYDRIFIPSGEKITISDMPLEKKNSFSQRGKVFNQLGEYLTESNVK